MKKIFKFSIGIITGIALFTSMIISSDKVFANDIDPSQDILKVISSGDYESIKKLDLDDKNNIKRIIDIKSNKSISGLEDGLYAIDRKDGWVRGKDAGFLRSIIIPSGAQGGLQQISYEETTTRTTKKNTTTFGIDFIKMSLTEAYGEASGTGQEIIVKNFITAPTGKDIFFKAQTIYRKYELIRIKNGKIIDHGIQYKPTGYATNKIEYNSGAKVNQKQLYEKTDRNILGNPDYAIEELPEFVADITKEHAFSSNNPAYTTTDFIQQQKSVGIYFTVPNNGKYEIREKFMPQSAAEVRIGIGANMTLYKVKKENNKIIEVIDSKPYNFVEYNWFVQHIGTPLTGNLRADEKYLLVINPSNAEYWPDVKNRSIMYNIQLKKTS